MSLKTRLAGIERSFLLGSGAGSALWVLTFPETSKEEEERLIRDAEEKNHGRKVYRVVFVEGRG